ncbi:MAG: acetate--CoA ligase family protein [Chloroflexi bacterium]|nr:acetate--CoA ligase family protein [Chloroflexota bacterium]
MRLFEFEAKKLIKDEGIPVPEGRMAEDVSGVKKIFSELGGAPVVIKSQILAGARGKSGGITFAGTAEQAEEEAGRLLGSKIREFPVKNVLIEEKVKIAEEFYLGVTIDRMRYKIVLIACAEGGVEIEEVAKSSPEKIKKLAFDANEDFYPHHGLVIARRLGLSGDKMKEFGKIASKLFKAFKKYDAKLLEINPLVYTDDGRWVAVDTRMSIDEDALFRQKTLVELGVEGRHEEGELTPRELEAREAGIPYLDLDGNIGMFPGGAGMGIASIDLITDLGGSPANFMDSGGGPTPERLARMLKLLVDNPKVDVIFGARFGGVSRCDVFAEGVIMYLKDEKPEKPMIMRMTGNMWKEGLEMFEKAKAESPGLFEKIKIYGIETPIEDVAKEAVEAADEISAGKGVVR